MILSEGRWTHDFPITVQIRRSSWALPVTTDMPRMVYELMDLYPQANARRPSVIYVPIRGFGDGKTEPGAPGPATPIPNSASKSRGRARIRRLLRA